MMDHAFQFHCMICYEEFENTVLRYPVVLPCGHTYVCKGCGDKLEKCMECREPLYMTVMPETNNNTPPFATPPPPPSQLCQRGPATLVRSNRATVRSGTTAVAPSSSAYAAPTNQVVPSYSNKPIKKRLPLPKNVVLLSLIEATQMISADSHSDSESNSDHPHDILPSVTASSSAPLSLQGSVDQEEDENKRAELAASVSVGVAGTYAVCCKEGLKIYPQQPCASLDLTRASSDTLTSMGDADVDTLVRFFYSDKLKEHQQQPPGQQISGSGLVGGATTLDMATLAFGDRIQVVSMDGGWAKLARGYGFVSAEKNQIVKVGSAVDRACILEAMLHELSERKRLLRVKQSKIDNQFIKLMNHLQASLERDEDLTVICRTAFGEDENEEGAFEVVDSDSMTEKNEPEKDNPPRDKAVGRLLPFNINANGASTLSPIEPNVQGQGSKSGSPTFYGPSLFLSGTLKPTSPTPSEMRAGALAWRRRQAKEKAVNFRSGLSGHMALSAANRAHPHDYLGDPSSSKYQHLSKPLSSVSYTRVSSFRMSTHTGLTMSHRKSASRKSGLPSRSSVQDHIKLSGSM